jgi:hypothetical protein
LATLGQPERIYYTSKNFVSGYTDIVAFVKKPNNATAGPYPLVDSAENLFKGFYYFDLMTSLADPAGEWIISIVSPTEIAKVPYKVEFEQPSGGSSSVASSAGIEPIVGYVDVSQDIQGLVDFTFDILGFIPETNDVLGGIDSSQDVTGTLDLSSDFVALIDCT